MNLQLKLLNAESIGVTALNKFNKNRLWNYEIGFPWTILQQDVYHPCIINCIEKSMISEDTETKNVRKLNMKEVWIQNNLKYRVCICIFYVSVTTG